MVNNGKKIFDANDKWTAMKILVKIIKTSYPPTVLAALYIYHTRIQTLLKNVKKKIRFLSLN